MPLKTAAYGKITGQFSRIWPFYSRIWRHFILEYADILAAAGSADYMRPSKSHIFLKYELFTAMHMGHETFQIPHYSFTSNFYLYAMSSASNVTFLHVHQFNHPPCLVIMEIPTLLRSALPTIITTTKFATQQ